MIIRAPEADTSAQGEDVEACVGENGWLEMNPIEEASTSAPGRPLVHRWAMTLVGGFLVAGASAARPAQAAFDRGCASDSRAERTEGRGVASSLFEIPSFALDEILFASSRHARGKPQPVAGSETAGAIELYELHCAECHGAKGTGKAVRRTMPAIPDFTDASWQARRSDAQFLASILDGKGADMPPSGDELSDEQAHALVDFVRAFAPASEAAGQVSPEALASSQDFTSKLIRWLGNFHAPSVHFPIALLTAAALAELLRMAAPGAPERFQLVSRFCVWLGTLSALAAAVLGWFMGGFRLLDPSWVMTTHRWLGTLVAAGSLFVLFLCARSRPPDRRRTLIGFRAALFVLAGIVTVAGFFGGAVVFGINHYAWPE